MGGEKARGRFSFNPLRGDPMGRDGTRSGGLTRVRRGVATGVSFVVLTAGMVAALSTRGDGLLLIVTLVVAAFAVLLTARLRALELILAAMGLGLIIDAFAVDQDAANAPDHIIIGVAALFSVVFVRCRSWLARTASAAASAIAHRLQASALAANSPLGAASRADSEAEAAMTRGAISRLPASQLLTGLGIPLS